MSRSILERWLFGWRYWRGQTPWDTNVTPPEVLAFLRDAGTGRALDLGCGTGTNSITLAQHGWQVTGVDFVMRAIRQARRKARRAGLDIDFLAGDVTNLSSLIGPYQYALDVGCLHGVPAERWRAYAAGLDRLLEPGALYMLYAWLPAAWHGRMRGISLDQVKELFGRTFVVEQQRVGTERGSGSAWYWLRKRAP